MIGKLRFVLASCSALLIAGVLGLGTAQVSANDPTGQPESGSGGGIAAETLFAGVPIYSVMKTETSSLTGSPTPVNAFAPIALPCPATAGAAGCTYRVTVSSQFAEVSPLDIVRMNLIITGPGTIGPDALVNVATNSSPSWGQAYTMQWAKRNIPAGSTPTVTLQFVMNANFCFIGFRTMSIDVLSGLL